MPKELPAVRLADMPADGSPPVVVAAVIPSSSSSSSSSSATPPDPTLGIVAAVAEPPTHIDSGWLSNARHIPSANPNDPVIAASNSPIDSPARIPDVARQPSPALPKLSRAFSMPLASQLGHLRNPHTPIFPLPRTPDVRPRTPYDEMSTELADAAQMVIQTLLQLSPPQLLDPAKEQFSACSLQIPTSSITALLTSMKNLNYMSANMPTFSPGGSPAPSTPEEETLPETTKDNFDVGEMLQSVGDALGGLAAQAGVELVLFHGDVGMKHVCIRGDECAMLYALSHIVRQVLSSALRGDTIEIGLHISLPVEGASLESTLPPGTPLVCKFEVAHKYSDDAFPLVPRYPPQLQSTILARILRRTRATLRENLRPTTFPSGTCCELSVQVERGIPLVETVSTPDDEPLRISHPMLKTAREPTLDELVLFAETLRGKKVAFHASSQGSFAHHLTSYLTAWGMDVSHVPTDGAEEPATSIAPLSTSNTPSTDGPDGMAGSALAPIQLKPSAVSETADPQFIIIDDDVLCLRRRLVQLLPPGFFSTHPAKRPSLAAHHRPMSSPFIRPSLLAAGVAAKPPAVIVHFTSLANFKLVKEAIQSILVSAIQNTLPPEVIVIPKPAGPRRLLTALHTAVNKPIVDSFFSPIATSPMSPQTTSPFNSYYRNFPAGNFPAVSPQLSTYISPSLSPRSSRDNVNERDPNQPPSPLSNVDSLEYFSEAATRMGSASQGLVIQSPDGKPAGIFFQPSPRGAPKSSYTPSSSGRTLDRIAGKEKRKSNVNSRLVVTNSAPPMDIKAAIQGLATAARGPGSPPSLRSIPSDSSSKAKPRSASNGNLPDHTGTPPRSPPVSRSFSNNAIVPLTQAIPLPATATTPVGTAPSSVAMLPTSTSMDTDLTSGSSMGTMTMSGTGTDLESIHSEATANPNNVLSPPMPVPSLEQVPVPMTPRKSTSPITTIPPSVSITTSTPPPTVRKLTPRRITVDAKSPSNASLKGAEIVPPISVLIVEDNPINQTILSTFMKKKKIKYGVAKDGAEAVEKWRTGGFHLILMDIQMPVMDGIDATKEIRRLEKTNNIGLFPSTPPSDGQRTPSSDLASASPSAASSATATAPPSPYRSSVIIVALTASSLNADRVAALAAGCNDFLTKPVSLKWLDKKILEWGSIKALQMWADPEMARSFANGQAEKARAVANQLQIIRGTGGAGSSTAKRASSPITGRPSSPAQSISSSPPPPPRPQPIKRPSTSAIHTAMQPPSRPRTPSPLRAAVRIPTDTEETSFFGVEPCLASQPQLDSHSPLSLQPQSSLSTANTLVSGEEALKSYLDDVRISEAVKEPGQLSILGARGLSTHDTSIEAVIHSTPPVGFDANSHATFDSLTSDSTEAPPSDPPHQEHKSDTEGSQLRHAGSDLVPPD